jgi:hypothetical protein
MSVVFVVVPAVAAGWPMIAAAVGAACAGLGFTVESSRDRAKERVEQIGRGGVAEGSVEMEMANAEVIGSALARDESIQVSKEGVTATFRKNARGKLTVHVDGKRSREELTAVGQQLMNRVRQQYATEKVKSELLGKGFVLVDEQVDERNNIRLKVRRFQ